MHKNIEDTFQISYYHWLTGFSIMKNDSVAFLLFVCFFSLFVSFFLVEIVTICSAP
jgi:hypothetical protein